jgi:hypothetical protein
VYFCRALPLFQKNTASIFGAEVTKLRSGGHI